MNRIDRSCCDGMDDLAGALPALGAAYGRFTRDVLREGGRMGQSFLGLLGGVTRDPCCTIPEQDCPPRCVCTLEWDARRGERLRGTIRVTNTDDKAVAFQFGADPFSGAPVAPQVAPSSATLAPGASVDLDVWVDVSEKLEPGRYRSEVRILGSHEQCVILKLNVEAREVPHCEVQHGPPPTKVHALHWYRHYQCEEPCEPSRATPGTAPGAVPGAPLSHG